MEDERWCRFSALHWFLSLRESDFRKVTIFPVALLSYLRTDELEKTAQSFKGAGFSTFLVRLIFGTVLALLRNQKYLKYEWHQKT